MNRRLIWVIGVLGLAAACAAPRPASTLPGIERIQTGVTTKEDVMRILGNPNEVRLVAGQEHWVYFADAPARRAPEPSAPGTQYLGKTEAGPGAPPLTPGVTPSLTERRPTIIQFDQGVVIRIVSGLPR